MLNISRCNSRRLRLWVLLAYLLVIAAAGIGPFVASAEAAAICSASAKAQGRNGPRLDCPLCLPASSPPVAAAAVQAAEDTCGEVLTAIHIELLSSHRPALPPARGPPIA